MADTNKWINAVSLLQDAVKAVRVSADGILKQFGVHNCALSPGKTEEERSFFPAITTIITTTRRYGTLPIAQSGLFEK